jgi:hypothetical protein
LSFGVLTLLVYNFGFLYGFIGIILIFQARELILKYLFKLDPLCCMDYLFLHDSKESRANLLGSYLP